MPETGQPRVADKKVEGNSEKSPNNKLGCEITVIVRQERGRREHEARKPKQHRIRADESHHSLLIPSRRRTRTTMRRHRTTTVAMLGFTTIMRSACSTPAARLAMRA